MIGTAAGEGLALLHAAADVLQTAGLTELSSVDVVSLLTKVETQRRRLEAVDARLLAEVSERGLAGDYGRTSTADLLTCTLRVAPAEAKARVARSRDLGPRRELSGEPLPALFPLVAAAQQAGSISAGHAVVIADCLDRIPVRIAHEVVPVAERFLVEAAEHEDPRALRRTAALLLARVHPDGVEPRAAEIDRRRGFTLSPVGDGSYRASGRLNGEAGAVWQTILDSLSSPMPAADGIPDERSAAQRRHDAMLEAGMRVLRSGSLPDCGGTPVTVLFRTTAEDLGRPGGVAQTAHGELISAERVLRLASDRGDAGGAHADGRHPQLRAPGATGHGGPAARAGGPRWRLLLPAVHETSRLGRGPPRPALDRRRRHRHREHVPALRVPSSRVRTARLDARDDRRRPLMDPAAVAGSGPKTPAQHRTSLA